MAKYALLYLDDGVESRGNPTPEQQAVYGSIFKWFQTNGSRFVDDGAELQPARTATTLRKSGGKVKVSDGPFIEAKEGIGGFSIILFTVSTRIILGHAGQSHLFRKRLRFLIAALALLVVATIARVGADFIPPARNSHLVYAAVIWLLAALIWACALVPKLSLSGE